MKNLKDMSRKLLGSPSWRKKKNKGARTGTGRIKLRGLQFTIKIMDFFHFPVLTVSDYGLLEGAILEIEGKDEKNISENWLLVLRMNRSGIALAADTVSSTDLLQNALII